MSSKKKEKGKPVIPKVDKTKIEKYSSQKPKEKRDN